MQSQISRILNSSIGTEVLTSLENNEEEITKLQRMLTQKNNQIFHLHSMINGELQNTIQENEKLYICNKNVLKHINEVQIELKETKKAILDQRNEREAMFLAFAEEMQRKIGQFTARNNQFWMKQQSQQQTIRQSNARQSNSRIIEQEERNSNSQILNRLQKMQQTIITLKQEKWNLEKELKKFQSMFVSQSPEKEYSSNQTFTDDQKRLFIAKCFNDCFSNLEERKYCGQMVGKCKNGKGVCEYNDGFVYEGAFVAGMRNGLGEMKYQGQLVYKGYWKKGKPSGKGSLYYLIDPSIVNFHGFFKDGKIEGYGSLLYCSGQKIRANFNEGKIKGAVLVEDSENNQVEYVNSQSDLSESHQISITTVY